MTGPDDEPSKEGCAARAAVPMALVGKYQDNNEFQMVRKGEGQCPRLALRANEMRQSDFMQRIPKDSSTRSSNRMLTRLRIVKDISRLY